MPLMSSPHDEAVFFFLAFVFKDKIALFINVEIIWLVVSTQLKNISQIGSFAQIGVNIKNI